MRSVFGDGGANVSQTPSTDATASQTNDAPACSTAGSGVRTLGGRGRGRRSIQTTFEKKAANPPTMNSANTHPNGPRDNRVMNRPVTPV